MDANHRVEPSQQNVANRRLAVRRRQRCTRQACPPGPYRPTFSRSAVIAPARRRAALAYPTPMVAGRLAADPALDHVGVRVRHWRLKRNLTQRALAELAGFTQGYIAQIES